MALQGIGIKIAYARICRNWGFLFLAVLFFFVGNGWTQCYKSSNTGCGRSIVAPAVAGQNCWEDCGSYDYPYNQAGYGSYFYASGCSKGLAGYSLTSCSYCSYCNTQ